jgi:hypothetical protein
MGCKSSVSMAHMDSLPASVVFDKSRSSRQKGQLRRCRSEALLVQSGWKAQRLLSLQRCSRGPTGPSVNRRCCRQTGFTCRNNFSILSISGPLARTITEFVSDSASQRTVDVSATRLLITTGTTFVSVSTNFRFSTIPDCSSRSMPAKNSRVASPPGLIGPTEDGCHLNRPKRTPHFDPDKSSEQSI